MCFSLSAFPCAADLCAVLRSFLIIFEAMKGFGFCFLGLVWFFVFVCFVVGLFLAPPPPFSRSSFCLWNLKGGERSENCFYRDLSNWQFGHLRQWLSVSLGDKKQGSEEGDGLFSLS